MLRGRKIVSERAVLEELKEKLGNVKRKIVRVHRAEHKVERTETEPRTWKVMQTFKEANHYNRE